MRIRRLCIIGIGLIGASLARALRVQDAVEEIIGCDRDAQALEKARALGVIDRAAIDIGDAVQDADIVVVAVPVGAMQQVFAQLQPHLTPSMIVTDVGSTKGSVVNAARQVFGTVPVRFIPGHPIAGTEKSGVEAAFAELFRGRKVILTPLPETDAAAVAHVQGMWERTGAQVMAMSVQHHDQVLAATSHLPHVLAYTLVHTLASMDDKREIFQYAAGGFRDFTRIASSDPSMWQDICLANRDALLAVIRKFGIELEQLAQAIRREDAAYVLSVFEQAKQARDRFAVESETPAKTHLRPGQ